jgi:hypothetical protein
LYTYYKHQDKMELCDQRHCSAALSKGISHFYKAAGLDVLAKGIIKDAASNF